jgi:hypothetical protein
MDNLVLACRLCNSSRSSVDALHFLQVCQRDPAKTPNMRLIISAITRARRNPASHRRWLRERIGQPLPHNPTITSLRKGAQAA